ncbi:MAG: GNAT family N-acetyltransferase [Acidimicrobiales bacterium]
MAGPIRTARLELRPISAEPLQFTIAKVDTGEVVGGCGARRDPSQPERAELDLDVVPGQQGNGYGAEVLRTLLDHVFTLQGARRVVAVPPSVEGAQLLGRFGFASLPNGNFELTLERWFPD